MTAPATVTIPTDGPRLTALSWGPSDGPLALCLHGAVDTAWTWRRLGPALGARGYRVIAPFGRGYAPSEPASDSDYRAGALVADALATAEMGGRGDRSLIVGHGCGAIVAAGAAALAPERWSEVVTLGAPPLPVLADAARSLRVALLVSLAVRNVAIGAMLVPGFAERRWDAFVRHAWREGSPGWDAGEDLAHLDVALPTPARRDAALRWYGAWLRSVSLDPQGAPYAEEQDAVSRVPPRPVLHVHGERDGRVPVTLARRADRVLAPGSRVVTLPDAGHVVHLQRPDDVLAAITAFAT